MRAGLVAGTEPSAHEGASEPTQTFVAGTGEAQVSAPEPVMSVPHAPTEADPSGTPRVPAPGPTAADVVRYGPGVPAAPAADRAELTAERAWRGSAPAGRSRRPRWLRLLLGWPLTVILLAACGVVLYLRFHHAPFHVTGVTVSQGTQAGCGTDVTGRIATNGAAGTVTYQWLVAPDTQPPRPLDQSVVSGQHDVAVTLDIDGAGNGSASQAVTLQVLSPDPATASTTVIISCG
jgi:hypothetical protein